MMCWIVTRSDCTNKDNCWLNIEFWVFLHSRIVPIASLHYFSFCYLFMSQQLYQNNLNHIFWRGRSHSVGQGRWNDNEGIFLCHSSSTRFWILLWACVGEVGSGKESKRKGKRDFRQTKKYLEFLAPYDCLQWFDRKVNILLILVIFLYFLSAHFLLSCPLLLSGS